MYNIGGESRIQTKTLYQDFASGSAIKKMQRNVFIALWFSCIFVLEINKTLLENDVQAFEKDQVKEQEIYRI